MLRIFAKRSWETHHSKIALITKLKRVEYDKGWSPEVDQLYG
jgi:hypothetical protein